jgi:ketosteroid isomerase-like protein
MDSVTLAKKWMEAFNGRDLEGLLALYTDDCEHTSPKLRERNPESGGKVLGKASLHAWWDDAFKRLPSLQYELTSITASADRVFIEYVRHVVSEPPMPIAEVFDIRDGRIRASRVYHG